jgi:hypothetical protein
MRRERNLEVAKRFDEEITQNGHYYVMPPLSYYEVHWWLLWKGATAQTKILMTYMRPFTLEST